MHAPSLGVSHAKTRQGERHHARHCLRNIATVCPSSHRQRQIAPARLCRVPYPRATIISRSRSTSIARRVSLEVSGPKSTAGIAKVRRASPAQPAELERFVRGETRQVFANSSQARSAARGDRLIRRVKFIPPEFAGSRTGRKVNRAPAQLRRGGLNLPRSTLLAAINVGATMPRGNAFEPPAAIVPTLEVWLTVGVQPFRTRAVQCTQCHGAKRPRSWIPRSEGQRTVRHPGCRQPPVYKPASQPGVCDSCIDCHRYHNGACRCGNPAENLAIDPRNSSKGPRPGRGRNDCQTPARDPGSRRLLPDEELRACREAGVPVTRAGSCQFVPIRQEWTPPLLTSRSAGT